MVFSYLKIQKRQTRKQTVLKSTLRFYLDTIIGKPNFNKCVALLLADLKRLYNKDPLGKAITIERLLSNSDAPERTDAIHISKDAKVVTERVSVHQ